ncbi:sigma-54-dependent Fis family transcriptional regulator [Leadbettera azotonutricia]|uniref:Transcriptional regulator, NifA subfamily, Fis Family n=1 Tax=Leadbettera azotonutricia (strain ATCC BAA-888 / DSM 13862 / ZAS-9) TaxID=545695 RepID=F5YBR6_LEAAZ|nr:sigma-54-dependent Fis family transcriptional regulator [Leadbettera azotonutricia]AEF81257.1 transcriptional regulator, NifA subfamily, Fis Family [Leadbettera azotonutricia ZAS-9]
MDSSSHEMEELELLFDIARTFDKHVELRTALGPLLSLMETRAGLTWGMVTLLDRATGLLKIEEAYGLTAEEKARGIYRLGEGLVGRVFESGIAIIVPDLSRETHFLNRSRNRTREDMVGLTYYCVPIRSGGSVIGTLNAERRIQDDDRSAKMAQDKTFLEKVSSIIADSAKLRERIMEEQFRYRSEKVPDDRLNEDRSAKAQGGGRIAAGSDIIGTDKSMRSLYEMLLQVSPSDATVLITGESGTGKELVAAEIHRLSKRVGAPLIKINCAALPESIIESELFGHERGAFTGAVSQRKGRFELANRGTIFLDEIGELPPQIQVKLLRVLQERELERVGGTQTIKVDVRLVAATNRNLEEEVKSARFREDLYYRLNVFPLHIPPLRERKSDIVLLADHFAEKYAEKNGKLIKRISTPAIDLLTSYSWPGNVRELENCMERAVILSQDSVVHSYNLPPSLQSAASTNTEPTTTLEAALSRLEKELIVEALKIADGNMAAAARRLGVTERQMGLRVHHYGINWRLYRATRM